MVDIGGDNMSGNYICGAYPSAPSQHSDDKDAETAFYDRLRSMPQIGGIEIPFWGEATHPFGDAFMQSCLHADWVNVMTCVPLSMDAKARDLKIGLAAKDEEARQHSIAMHERAYRAFQDFNEQAEKNIFKAVHLVSAPAGGPDYASKDALQKSLAQIAGWDWGGIDIFIEHCDAHKPDGSAEKGLLSLEEELQVIDAMGIENLGVALNTGRSTVEGRDADHAITHLEMVQQSGVPFALMFSGSTGADDAYGPWKDLHMPFGAFEGSKFPYPNSSLSKDALDRLFDVLDERSKALAFIGFKVMPLPQSSATINRRVGINEDAITILDSYLNR